MEASNARPSCWEDPRRGPGRGAVTAVDGTPFDADVGERSEPRGYLEPWWG